MSGEEEKEGGVLLVMPSVMMSVILQQDDNILMLSWSTIRAWRQEDTLQSQPLCVHFLHVLFTPKLYFFALRIASPCCRLLPSILPSSSPS